MIKIPRITFDKTLTIRLSAKQYDILQNSSSRLGKDGSQIIRELIEGLENRPEELIKQRDIYLNLAEEINKKLEKITIKLLEEEKESDDQGYNNIKNIEKFKVNEEIKNESDEITKTIPEHCIDVFFEKNIDKDKINNAKKETKKHIRSKIKKVDENIRNDVANKIIHHINRLYKVKKEDVFSGIKSIIIDKNKAVCP